MSEPEATPPERPPFDSDPAEALRQTYLYRLDATVRDVLFQLLRVFEGLRFFESRRQPLNPDAATREGYEACLADLRHVAGKLRGLAAEHEDDDLTAIGLGLITSATHHTGRLDRVADDLEAALEKTG